jgi:hypothetical protein
MTDDSLQQALKTLEAERTRLDAAISALETALGTAAPKPPRKKAGKLGSARTKKAKLAPRGLLKQKIHQVLKMAGRPLPPAALRDRVIKAGYPARNPKNLYTQIFALGKKDKAIVKTKAGFSLKCEDKPDGRGGVA